jgi:hypothetical protein
MYYIPVLTVSFALFTNAFPQAPPMAPSQEKGAPKGGSGTGGAPKSGLGGIFTTPPGADGPDMRGLADFLKTPSIPKLLGSFGIKGVEPLWNVPGIQEYAKSYLDFRNISNLPFVVAMPYGPSPTGCSPYEILIGRFLLMFGVNDHIGRGRANNSSQIQLAELVRSATLDLL